MSEKDKNHIRKRKESTNDGVILNSTNGIILSEVKLVRTEFMLD